MSKLIFSKFKKSLGQSSNIISESRLSSSVQREFNMLEGMERTPEPEREYIDKSSLNNTYRNSLDHNKLIKKIPELISENDELKEKVKKMEEQLTCILQAQKKRSSFSFRQDFLAEEDDRVESSMNKQRVSRLEQVFHLRPYNHSLDHYHLRSNNKEKHFENHSRFYKEGNREEILEKDKINVLKLQLKRLSQQNKILKQQNKKLNRLKHENITQIDAIMTKFQQTLSHKDELTKTQIGLLQQKLSKSKYDLQLTLAEKNGFIQECQKLKKMLQTHINNQNNFHKLVQTNFNHQLTVKQQKQKEIYKLTETVQHLWQVKQAQTNNLLAIIRYLKVNTH